MDQRFEGRQGRPTRREHFLQRSSGNHCSELDARVLALVVGKATAQAIQQEASLQGANMCIKSTWTKTLRHQSIAVAVIAAGVIGSACSKGATAPEPSTRASQAQASSATQPTPNANACRSAAPKGASEVAETLTVLRRFDRLRREGYKPAFELPTRPPVTPCQTTFAKAPAKDEYEAAFRTVERDLDSFTADFEKKWGRIQLGANAPASGSELLLASATGKDVAVPSVGACQVVDVTGGCSRRCGTWADSECKNGRQQWDYSCIAKATCSAEPALSSESPGLEYSANEYLVEFRASGKEPSMREFRAQVGKLKVGDAFRVPVSAWRFSKTWVAEADLAAGTPTVIE